MAARPASHTNQQPAPAPPPANSQVLIKAASAGVNPVDLIVRNGIYAPTKFPKVRFGCRRGGMACEAPVRLCASAQTAMLANLPTLCCKAEMLLRMQVLGGDVAGVVEEADEGSQVCN